MKNTLVTIDSGGLINTYVVYGEIQDTGELILTHPLLSDVYILTEKDKVNNALALARHPLEKCLRFLIRHKEVLSYDERLDLDSLAMYYGVRGILSGKQKSEIASMCGKVASILNGRNLKKCAEIVIKNSALLDDFNLFWYKKLERLFRNPDLVTSKKQKNSIFNITGFVLAQLEE